MSYILDALRKADAQRERDPARGIHAQSIFPHGASPDRRLPRATPVWVGGGLILVASLLAAGWYVSRGDSAQRTLAVAAATAPAAVSPPALPAVPDAAHAPSSGSGHLAPVTAAPPRAAGTNPLPEPAASDRLGAQQVQNLPAPGTPRTARGAAAAWGARMPSSAVPGLAPDAAPAATQAPVPTPAPSVPSISAPAQATSALPPDAPKIAISGGVYSPSAAQRMLIVNGQVFNEGSEIAPGVTVEEIKARTAVLKFRGSLYTVAY